MFEMYWMLAFGLLSPFLVVAESNDRPLLQELFVPKSLKENQTIRLVCSISQGESVDFEWFLNDQKLEQNDKRRIKINDESSELVIRPLSVDDLGDYKCVGKNRHGQDVQKASLVFNFKPQWLKEPQDVIGNLNKEITLECDAKGYPTPETQFFKVDNKQKVIKEFNSNRINFELTKESSGLYKCSSTNSIGSIEKVVSVGYFGK